MKGRPGLPKQLGHAPGIAWAVQLVPAGNQHWLTCAREPCPVRLPRLCGPSPSRAPHHARTQVRQVARWSPAYAHDQGRERDQSE